MDVGCVSMISKFTNNAISREREEQMYCYNQVEFVKQFDQEREKKKQKQKRRGGEHFRRVISAFSYLHVSIFPAFEAAFSFKIEFN